jgi:hypothetical protein
MDDDAFIASSVLLVGRPYSVMWMCFVSELFLLFHGICRIEKERSEIIKEHRCVLSTLS